MCVSLSPHLSSFYTCRLSILCKHSLIIDAVAELDHVAYTCSLVLSSHCWGYSMATKRTIFTRFLRSYSTIPWIIHIIANYLIYSMMCMPWKDGIHRPANSGSWICAAVAVSQFRLQSHRQQFLSLAAVADSHRLSAATDWSHSYAYERAHECVR